ncbi:DUF202 domain-containing protein [Paludibacteraceae bacterium OttesenSCG-928-F17]|nr:DUF202 domain-containing protein [Paludibacteraceae bacterium OttesenSCG-928-F17]
MNRRVKKIVRFTDDFEHKDKMTLNEHLSIERTKLSNERTLFSYIRTSLYLVIGGIGLTELKTFEHLRYLGYIALSFSGVLLIIGFIRYYQLHKHLKSYIALDKRLKEESKDSE